MPNEHQPGEKQLTPSELFRQQIVELDKEELADIQRQIEAGTYEFPEVEWLDDPDPFGMDWGWLYGPKNS